MPEVIPVLTAPAEWTVDFAPAVDATVRSLLGSSGTRLIVDLSATTFLASVGLTFLIHLGKRLSEARGGLALAGPQPPVVKLLRAVGLTGVLKVFSSVDAARAHLSSLHPMGRS